MCLVHPVEACSKWLVQAPAWVLEQSKAKRRTGANLSTCTARSWWAPKLQWWHRPSWESMCHAHSGPFKISDHLKALRTWKRHRISCHRFPILIYRSRTTKIIRSILVEEEAWALALLVCKHLGIKSFNIPRPILVEEDRQEMPGEEDLQVPALLALK